MYILLLFLFLPVYVTQISLPWSRIYRQKMVIDSTCTRKSRCLYSDLLSPRRPYFLKLPSFGNFSSLNVSFAQLHLHLVVITNIHFFDHFNSNQRREGGLQHAHFFAETREDSGYAHPRHVRRSHDRTSWGNNPLDWLQTNILKGLFWRRRVCSDGRSVKCCPKVGVVGDVGRRPDRWSLCEWVRPWN